MVVYIMLLCLWSDLNYIYMFWLNLNFFADKYTVGVVGTVAAPTNQFVETADVPRSSLQIDL